MCPACQAEYDDPEDRRFHAQPNACPQCGPRVTLLGAGGAPVDLGGSRRSVRRGRSGRSVTARSSRSRGSAAITSRAVPATSCRREAARAQAPRGQAVCADGRRSGARGPVGVPGGRGAGAAGLSPPRPIVLRRRRTAACRRCGCRAVAPRAPELGVMLPYSPLHHLLLADAGGALVMTSGNVSDEPIAFEDEDALARLGQIADLFVVHDRPIETRTDDSVVRRVAGGVRPSCDARAATCQARLRFPAPARRGRCSRAARS